MNLTPARPMTGRDPEAPHRASTPLELLFDLAFVVAFGVAGDQAAHLLAEGHVAPAVAGFGFSMFAICWAWINFTWFASAFDTDDWVYRVTTMVQMIGVVVLALGLPEMFGSLEEGGRIHNEVMVAGYIIMRCAMLVQWLRAARQAPQYRASCLTYARFLVLAQVGWIALAVAPVNVATFFVVGALLVVLEMSGPWFAERFPGGGDGLRGTPWHPHHIAERYGLLVIITLGEGVIGTVASLTAVVETSGGWTVDAVLLSVAGVGLTFGLWWNYFTTPAGELLHEVRHRSFVWGYLHLVAFAALAAVGAGLHVAAYYLEHHSHLSAQATVQTVALPVALYLIAHHVLHRLLTSANASGYRGLLLAALVLLAVAVAVAGTDVPMTWALLLVAAAPAVSVVGRELLTPRQ